MIREIKKEIDYLIVGQGIAGTVMAQTLLKEECTVLIMDDPSLSKASKVAAGLYNPVVFKRLVKSWMTDELIPIMNDFYADAEKMLNETFYHKKQIVKLFADENEKAFWLKKTNEEIGKYLSKQIQDDFLSGMVDCPFGASEVVDAGNLNMLKFLTAFKVHFKKQGILIEEKFDFDQLKLSENNVSYKEYAFKKIIFCEGYKTTENFYFSWLPFKLTKGEVLTIKLAEDKIIPISKVINKGVFILPIGNNSYKVGATYEWNELNEEPTEKGKADLLQKLQKVIKVPFEIIDHQAGIRPTVVDRRPLIGLHPKYSTLAVFNGMGTKGVMLAPYFAKQFVGFLKEKSSLDKEVDIARFSGQVT